MVATGSWNEWPEEGKVLSNRGVLLFKNQKTIPRSLIKLSHNK
jgi:hypothetical protein